MLLSGPDEAADIAVLRDLDVDAVIHHPRQFAWLEGATSGPQLRVWLKIDTAWGLGFPLAQAVDIHRRLRSCPVVHEDIVCMTHFARSDEFGESMTHEQIQRFDACLQGVPGERSLANSAAVIGWPASHASWIRPGGALYGLSSVDGRNGTDLGLRPAMTLSTRLIADKLIQAGNSVGYGAGFVSLR